MAATRRSVLKRGLAFVGGLVGLGAAGEASARPIRPGAGTLVLYARNMDSFSGSRRSSRPAARGERLTGHGELLDRPDGRPVGEVYSTTISLRGPGASSPDAERLEWHTFRLRGGTIIGSGTAGRVEGQFAILGGTGRYAGARGTYVARRGEQGGDGTAEFVMYLIL
jgi:hypothetical protein